MRRKERTCKRRSVQQWCMRARDHRITQLEKHIATIRPAVEQLQTSGRTNSVKRIVAKMIHKKKCLSFFWWLNKLHTVQREERIVCKFVTRMKQRLEWQAFHAMVQHARVRVRHRAVVLHGRRSFFFVFSSSPPPLLLRFLLCRLFSSSVRAHAWLSLPSVLCFFFCQHWEEFVIVPCPPPFVLGKQLPSFVVHKKEFYVV